MYSVGAGRLEVAVRLRSEQGIAPALVALTHIAPKVIFGAGRMKGLCGQAEVMPPTLVRAARRCRCRQSGQSETPDGMASNPGTRC